MFPKKISHSPDPQNDRHSSELHRLWSGGVLAACARCSGRTTWGSESELTQSRCGCGQVDLMLCHFHCHSPTEHRCSASAGWFRLARKRPHSLCLVGWPPYGKISNEAGPAFQMENRQTLHHNTRYGLCKMQTWACFEDVSTAKIVNKAVNKANILQESCGVCGKGDSVRADISETSSAWRRHMAFELFSPEMDILCLRETF